VKVLLHDDLRQDPRALLRDLYAFLEVPEHFPAELEREVNAGQQPKSRTVARVIGAAKMAIHGRGLQWLLPVLQKTGALALVKAVKQRNLARRSGKEEVPADLRRELLDHFRPDVEKLEQLLQRELPAWKR
jgi:hypothetical protein